MMNSQDVIGRLRENEAALRARGVAHVALFGSLARGDDRLGSDADILVETAPEARVTVFEFAGLQEFIAGLFDGPVDVVDKEGLKARIRPFAIADAIYAF